MSNQIKEKEQLTKDPKKLSFMNANKNLLWQIKDLLRIINLTKSKISYLVHSCLLKLINGLDGTGKKLVLVFLLDQVKTKNYVKNKFISEWSMKIFNIFLRLKKFFKVYP